MTDTYPLALLPIANKPILFYQLEYLENNGIKDIFIVVEKKFAKKIDRCLRNYYKPKPTTDIELVILSDEEESANVLKLMKDKIIVSKYPPRLSIVL